MITRITAFFLLSLASCASTVMAGAHHRCEVRDLSKVFAKPLRYDGKFFCGSVLMIVKPYVAFLTNEAIGMDRRTALLPEGERQKIMQLVPIGSRTVFVTGRLRVDKPCVTGTYVCTPVDKPIYIRDFNVSDPR